MKYGNISSFVDLESFNNSAGISSTFFYYGCNFSCGYCHNHKMLADLGPTLSDDDVTKILDNAKRKWVTNIVVTGGEPTLDPNLKPFLEKVKENGFKVKLDTNGSNPEVLEDLINNNLVDYVAMDIKGTKLQYPEITGFDDLKKIQKSIDLIRTLDDYEFRTTVIPEYHKKSHLTRIGIWLSGSKRYVLQQFQPEIEGGCLDKNFEEMETYNEAQLNELKKIVEPYFEEVKVKCK